MLKREIILNEIEDLISKQISLHKYVCAEKRMVDFTEETFQCLVAPFKDEKEFITNTTQSYIDYNYNDITKNLNNLRNMMQPKLNRLMLPEIFYNNNIMLNKGLIKHIGDFVDKVFDDEDDDSINKTNSQDSKEETDSDSGSDDDDSDSEENLTK